MSPVVGTAQCRKSTRPRPTLVSVSCRAWTSRRRIRCRWTNFGTFTFSIGYNYFFTWKAEAVPGAGTHSFLGDYNNGTIPLAPGALPYHKGFLRGEWAWKGFDFVATGNYISSFNDDSAFVLCRKRVRSAARAAIRSIRSTAG